MIWRRSERRRAVIGRLELDMVLSRCLVIHTTAGEEEAGALVPLIRQALFPCWLRDWLSILRFFRFLLLPYHLMA